MKTTILTLCLLLFAACRNDSGTPEQAEATASTPQKEAVVPAPKKTVKTVHVFVALCDNKSQGIVPVPAMLGNGDDPQNNLYWGAMYGTKSFLKKSKFWTFVIMLPKNWALG